ncbi:MAG: hypothetical protein JWM81_538 [Candidatus Saccharibacteria bacterium]|nr:hypothetical protein [Candidatus Saccharibacteria bacterium]
MPLPKLSMQEIRRHPTVITQTSELLPGLDVALCYLIPPVKRLERCAQACLALMTRAEAGMDSRRESIKQGYKYTPAWGIVVSDVATINWVNTTNPMHKNPYASFTVTQSTAELPFAEKMLYRAAALGEVAALIEAVPPVEIATLNDEFTHSFELIKSFENLGLAPNALGQHNFVVDLTK